MSKEALITTNGSYYPELIQGVDVAYRELHKRPHELVCVYGDGELRFGKILSVQDLPYTESSLGLPLTFRSVVDADGDSTLLGIVRTYNYDAYSLETSVVNGKRVTTETGALQHKQGDIMFRLGRVAGGGERPKPLNDGPWTIETSQSAIRTDRTNRIVIGTRQIGEFGIRTAISEIAEGHEVFASSVGLLVLSYLAEKNIDWIPAYGSEADEKRGIVKKLAELYYGEDISKILAKPTPGVIEGLHLSFAQSRFFRSRMHICR